ncbi:uncharacterized protein LOC104900492 [Beta vulgaris subsp. vulgaris]|uniref:uncharacterized protein LOC104900492 n=1 Tax=Beta vulgaris subsp. vulgaris TaxID=3555 RepID=UPI00203676E1|nr:uncharacterized protein LOC104900492 [Beta vulgaris subsp. vulgaris]XP_010686212.2 uncharacterized protein LOC104900492 [Beta vulgaris subsp. vulgaris]XP_048490622.1 uncharacterized protein LOC104900492 [Beta vulgaris subsp. vulgaris]
MEKKQLNFSAPLMSARRYSSPLRTSGELNKVDSPPKNRHSIPSKPSDVTLEEVVKPGSVPFMWEQTPGKAKDGNESQRHSHDQVSMAITSKLPPSMPFPPGKKSGELNGFRTPSKLSGELNVLRPHKFSGELKSFRPHNKLSGELKTMTMVRWDSSRDNTEMNASSESEDDDLTFSDAIETFSQRESFSINCSVSGLSASERSETRQFDNLPTDPRARDFMMNRFLPAAKAMTLEPSQYASRKQLVAVDQSKEVKALLPRAKTPPPNQNVCSIVPYTGQDIGSEESDEEEDSYDGRSTLSVKVKACGFLPWFCSKNSLRLVNPLPTMKHRSKSALSSASKLSKLVKTKSWRSPSQKSVKPDPYTNTKHKVRQVYKSCELQKPPKHTSKPMFYSGELQTRSGSPYRSSRRSSVSPFQNESPHSLYEKGVGFLAVPRRVNSFEDNRSKIHQKGSKRFDEPGRMTRSSGTRSPVIEKTLYVDSVNITKVSHSILNLPKTKRQQVDGSVQEFGGRMEMMKARGMSGPLVCGGVDSSKPSRILEKGNTNTCRELVLVSSDDTTATQSALTPPLPRSPSESWLSRQLPSVSPRVSPRNSVSYSSMNSKILSRMHTAKTTSSGAKWETIVKTSHLREDHGRFSEELVHVSQQPRIWK